MKSEIVFLTPYPFDVAPSQRFRFEQQIQHLRANNFLIKQLSFLNHDGWDILYSEGKSIQKVMHVLRGFMLRWVHVLKCVSADFVFIHREVTPLGPPVFEWILCKAFGKKVIYDFDDAIWLSRTSEQNFLSKSLKFAGKVPFICKWASVVTVGNAYLEEFALRYNRSVELIPTTISSKVIKDYPSRSSLQNNVVIGWTGTHSTLKYLEQLESVLTDLLEDEKLSVKVICNSPPSFKHKRLTFVKWSNETEVKDLLDIDIGLMPLEDDEWAQGKCGFKALQYLALGIPVVASPVGVNSDIMKKSNGGYLASSELEWKERILEMKSKPALREQMGSDGKKFVSNCFSSDSISKVFLGLFRD